MRNFTLALRYPANTVKMISDPKSGSRPLIFLFSVMIHEDLLYYLTFAFMASSLHSVQLPDLG